MTSVEVCPICDIAGCKHIRERATQSSDYSKMVDDLLRSGYAITKDGKRIDPVDFFEVSTVDASKTPDPATNAPSCQQSTDYQRGLEDAAQLVETHAYTSSGDGPSMQPNAYAKHDTHHKTISAAIRALIATPPTPADPVKDAAKVLLDSLGDYERNRSHPAFEAAMIGQRDSNKPSPFNQIGDGLIAALRAMLAEGE